MKMESIKTLGFFAIILLLVVGITACSSSSGSLYDTQIEVVLENDEVLSQSNFNDFSNQIRLRNVNSEAALEMDSGSELNDNGDAVLTGEINNLKGDRDSVFLFHHGYEISSNRVRISQNQNSARFYFDVNNAGDGEIGRGDGDDNGEDGEDGDNGEDNGDKIDGNFVDVSVEKTSFGGTGIMQLDFDNYSQLGGTYYVHINIHHSNQSYTKEKEKLAEGEQKLRIDIDNDRNDDSAVVDILLINASEYVIAEKKNFVINEDIEEIDFNALDNPYEFENMSTAMSVEALSSSNYLAKYEMSASNNDQQEWYQEEWVNLQIGDSSVQDLPSGFFTVNDIAFDWDYDDDEFNRVFEHEHQMSGGQVENMDLYYSLNDQTSIQNARNQETVNNPEEVEANLTSIYIDADEYDDLDLSGTPPYPRASAEISLSYDEMYQDDQYVYYVTVHDFDGGIAGLPNARRFAVGSPSNTPVDFGVENEYTSGTKLTELNLYILGLDMSNVKGYGTSDNPYEISNAEEFSQALRSAEAREREDDAHFLLTGDIDMEDVEDWTPIGSENWPFQGYLDGNNRKISNLNIDRNGRVGLFGEIGEDALIENIRISGFDISGNSYVGALAGRNKGEIREVRLIDDNNISGEYSEIGGLVGSNVGEGKIFDSSVGAGTTVEGTGDETFRVGGLAGSNIDGTIKEETTGTLFSSAEVSGISQIGGFVGYNNSNGIEGARSDGDVNGVEEVGGFVGRNEGLIDSSTFENANVNGEENYIGGFAGYNMDSGLLRYNNQVLSAVVNGYNTVGGFTGLNKGKINNVDVFNTDVVGEDENVGGLVGDNTHDGDLRSSEFAGNVTGLDVVGGLAGRNSAGSQYSGIDPGNGVHNNRLDENNTVQATRDNPEYRDELIGHNTGKSSGNTGYGRLIVEGFKIDDNEIDVGGELNRRIANPGVDGDINIKVIVNNDGDLIATDDIEVEVSGGDFDHQYIENDFSVTPSSPSDFDFDISGNIDSSDEGIQYTITTYIDDESVGVGYFIVAENLEINANIDELNIELELEDSEEESDLKDYYTQDEIDDFGVLRQEYNDEVGFDSEKTDYEVSASHLHEYINLDIILESDYAVYDIELDDNNGDASIEGDRVTLAAPGEETVIKINVNAEDPREESKTYNITVVREGDRDIPSIVKDESGLSLEDEDVNDKITIYKDIEQNVTFTVVIENISDIEINDEDKVIIEHPYDDNATINLTYDSENENKVTFTGSQDLTPDSAKDVIIESITLGGNEGVLQIDDDNKVLGEIKVKEKILSISGNISNTSAKEVKVKFQFYDNDGNDMSTHIIPSDEYISGDNNYDFNLDNNKEDSHPEINTKSEYQLVVTFEREEEADNGEDLKIELTGELYEVKDNPEWDENSLTIDFTTSEDDIDGLDFKI